MQKQFKGRNRFFFVQKYRAVSQGCFKSKCSTEQGTDHLIGPIQFCDSVGQGKEMEN